MIRGAKHSTSATSSHSSRTGASQCVAECIVHRNKSAVGRPKLSRDEECPSWTPSVVRRQGFGGQGGDVQSADRININLVGETTDGVNAISWKYGIDISVGKVERRRTNEITDPDLSFELAACEPRVGQKIGMVVFRNCAFDFSNDDMWTENDWDKNKFTEHDIRRVFGPDNAASFYTGEIIRISDDRRVIEHDINTYKGCSGAIIFLLDKKQPTGLVNSQDHGKAIAIHAGCAVSEKKVLNAAGKHVGPTDTQKSNIGFTLRRLLANTVAPGGSAMPDDTEEDKKPPAAALGKAKKGKLRGTVEAPCRTIPRTVKSPPHQGKARKEKRSATVLPGSNAIAQINLVMIGAKQDGLRTGARNQTKGNFQIQAVKQRRDSRKERRATNARRWGRRRRQRKAKT
ncbi:expressed unknown protein [Seminavis robusta]|uniref:Uncharacterized protein n=1 Tax=Seminavis robusta TaxID=568900 RepID=A0A9N8DRD1_9STRA|nr:expressed unknown protein [Seminavis robusta]|eukprot:Sro285_g108060.1 n/a (401) ;mRNA; f:5335-6625